ncbi:transcriptional regulator, TetR family [Azospirillum oryzae]|uniref:Transcriptional regulator, TetR family n=2 Tax=Azospirillaceae TaxID=2829815 RepID=A0A1X7EKX4_9PROT|nr:transcriptional regulator, TetR family [Azospirillum oryzae]
MPVIRGKRWDPRPAETIQKILETIEQMVLREGSTELSVRAVCEEADIARGTFYRYFSSKEELLEGFSRHMREKFERKVGEVLESSVDPSERFAAYLRCVWVYLNADNARRLFEIEPVFSVKDFRQNFEQSIKRTQHVLDSTFTDWEAATGVTLDRDLLSELLIRYMLSELIVPSTGNYQDFLERTTRMVTALWPRPR